MRVVLDTNILVSSLWGGLPGRVVRECQAGRVRLLVSQAILDEYFEVLGRFEPDEEDLELLWALFLDPERTEVVGSPAQVRAVPEDPADDKFLGCAVAGKADCVVSGDRYLLRLKPFRGIPILTPRKFLAG